MDRVHSVPEERLLAEAEARAPAIWSRRSAAALDEITHAYGCYCEALQTFAVAAAHQLLADGLAIYVKLELETSFPLALEQFAAMSAAQGDGVRALRLAAAGAAWRLKLDTYPTPYAVWLDAYLSRARAALDETAVTAAWTEGEAMALKEAIAYAIHARTE